MLEVFLLALALMILLESLGPCLAPAQWKKFAIRFVQLPDDVLRRWGFAGLLFAAGMVAVVHHLYDITN